MPYIKKITRTRNGIFVTKSKCFYYNIENCKKKRETRLAPTPDGKKKRNEREKYLKIKYDILNNFDKGDMWATFTYREENVPDEPQQAHKIFMNMLACVKKKLKRKGIDMMYYVKTEAGENQRVHHHVFIKNNFAVISMLYDYWKAYGNIRDFKEIYNMSNGMLVKYFLESNHKQLNFEKYAHSRNIIPPKVETRILPAQSFRENPKPPKSENDKEYYIANLKNFFPDRDGFIYQEYEIREREVKKE